MPSALKQYRWQVVAMLWCVSVFNYADRSALFALFPLLEREMHLSTVQLGLLGSSFAWMYGICAPFSGAIVDRVKRKRAVLGGLYAWSLIASCTSLARGFVQLLAFTTAEGVGESFYYPASMSMISDYHGVDTRSRAMGLHQTSVYFGTITGAFFAGLIGQRFGWRWSFITFGGCGLVLGLVLMKGLREPQRQLSAVGGVDPKRSLIAFLRSLRRSPAALLLLAGFCCANFVAMVLLSWMPKFLYDRFGLSVALAGLSATVFVQLASMFGSPLGGWLADTMQAKRSGGRIAVQAAALFCGAPFVFLCSRADSVALIASALAVWGLFKGIYDANIFASLYDVIPSEFRGTGAGFMNMIGWLGGGGLAPVTIGFLAQHIGLAKSLGLTGVVYVGGGLVLLIASRISYAESKAGGRQPIVAAATRFTH
ncbi:MAG TPA: MFS transporter [Bryobacteraceae bacterium]|nr:MFS transporter [Bryobacteraceae bacterium]